MSQKVILDLCGGSGSWSKPYKEAGYDVRVITLPEYDVQTYESLENAHGILAAPPCTEFSLIKGSAYRNIENAMKIVDACMTIIYKCKPKWWALENPVGLLVSAMKNKYSLSPLLTFQPYQYGDGWQKHTAIWGDFKVPQFKYTADDCPALNLYMAPRCKKRGDKRPTIAALHKKEILNIPQLAWAKEYCKTDADARALTPPGFAKAFFEANQ